jgi:hypothetical protein
VNNTLVRIELEKWEKKPPRRDKTKLNQFVVASLDWLSSPFHIRSILLEYHSPFAGFNAMFKPPFKSHTLSNDQRASTVVAPLCPKLSNDWFA